MLVPFDPFAFAQSPSIDRSENRLLQYLKQQSPEVVAQLAESVSPEVQQLIAGNIQGLLGALPSNQFQTQVSTNRDNLAGLLASAMMTGYFLRNVEQRMELEGQFVGLATEEE